MAKRREYKRKDVKRLRTDVFVKKKTVSGRIDNEKYNEFRSKLFLLEISPTELFSEFLMLFLSDDKRVMSIVNDILSSKNDCKLKQIEYVTKDMAEFSDIDKKMLYDSLERNKND